MEVEIRICGPVMGGLAGVRRGRGSVGGGAVSAGGGVAGVAGRRRCGGDILGEGGAASDKSKTGQTMSIERMKVPPATRLAIGSRNKKAGSSGFRLF